MGGHWLPVSPLDHGQGLDAEGQGLELSTRSSASVSEVEYSEDEEQGKGGDFPLLHTKKYHSF